MGWTPKFHIVMWITFDVVYGARPRLDVSCRAFWDLFNCAISFFEFNMVREIWQYEYVWLSYLIKKCYVESPITFDLEGITRKINYQKQLEDIYNSFQKEKII